MIKKMVKTITGGIWSDLNSLMKVYLDKCDSLEKIIPKETKAVKNAEIYGSLLMIL